MPERVLPSASSSSMKMMHGARALGLGEQVAHAGRADADEHLDEFRSAEAEERRLGLAGDCLGQQRFAGARRADQQHALGNAAAEGLVLLRRLEEIDDLAQLGHGLVDAGHVLEADAQVFLSVELGLAAAERQRRGAGDPAHQHEQGDAGGNQHHDRQQHDGDALEHRLFFLALPGAADRFAQQPRQLGIVLQAEPLGAKRHGLRVQAVRPAVEDGVVQHDLAADVVVADFHVAQADAGVAAGGFQHLDELAVFEGRIGSFSVEEPVEEDAARQDGENGEGAARQPDAAAAVASFLHRMLLR